MGCKSRTGFNNVGLLEACTSKVEEGGVKRKRSAGCKAGAAAGYTGPFGGRYAEARMAKRNQSVGWGARTGVVKAGSWVLSMGNQCPPSLKSEYSETQEGTNKKNALVHRENKNSAGCICMLPTALLQPCLTASSSYIISAREFTLFGRCTLPPIIQCKYWFKRGPLPRQAVVARDKPRAECAVPVLELK